MIAAFTLWTFTFFHPLPMAGRKVVDLSERDCHRLLFDVVRLSVGRIPDNVKVGECRPQRTP